MTSLCRCRSSPQTPCAERATVISGVCRNRFRAQILILVLSQRSDRHRIPARVCSPFGVIVTLYAGSKSAIPSTHASILNRVPRFCAPRFLLVWTHGVLIHSPPVILQYLSLNVHRITLSTGWVFGRIGAGFVCLLSQGKEAEPVSKEKHDNSQNRLQVGSKTRSSWRRGKGK